MFISKSTRIFTFNDGSLESISSSLLVVVSSPTLSFILYGYNVLSVLIHSVSLAFFLSWKGGICYFSFSPLIPLSFFSLIWARYLAPLHIPLIKWWKSILQCLCLCLKSVLCKLHLAYNFCTISYWNEYLQKVISTNNYMFGRVVWDKLPECILKIMKFQNFQKSLGWFIPKLLEPNMWLLVNHTKPTNSLYWN